MPRWKKCPKCGGYIPEGWSKHDKCGWSIEKKFERDEFIEEMNKSMEDAMQLMREWCKKYPEEASHLDLTKIGLTLFIQRRREKLLQSKQANKK